MKLFNKRPKDNPIITIQGILLEFDLSHLWWSFTYRDIDFIAYGLEFSMPEVAKINSIIDQIEALKGNMLEKIKYSIGKSGIPENSFEQAEFTVNIENMVQRETFIVSWTGPESWVDLGVDFTIENNDIVDEFWAD